MQQNNCARLNHLFLARLAGFLLVTVFTPVVTRADVCRVEPESCDKSEYELDIEGRIAVRFYDSLKSPRRDARYIIQQVENNIRNMEQFLPVAEKYSGGYSNWSLTGRDSFGGGALRVPNFFTADDITALRAAYEKFSADAIELDALNKTLFEYLKNPESKREKYKTYTDAKPRLLDLIEKIRAESAALDAYALKIAAAGEARTLQKNPCGVYIVNMREMIDLINQLIPLATDPAFKERDSYEDRRNKRAPETDDEKATRMTRAAETADKIDVLAKQIATLREKHKAVSTEPINYTNKSATETSLRELQRFYDSDCERIITNAGKISEGLRAKGIMRDYDAIAGYVRNLVREHDEFVHMFNLWAGGTQAMQRGND